jgi:hypothetical protein
VTDLRLAKLKPEILRTVAPDLTCLAGLQTAGAGGVRPRPCRAAVCAPSNRSDGHAPPGAQTAAKLTLQVDHSMGAGHKRKFGAKSSGHWYRRKVPVVSPTVERPSAFSHSIQVWLVILVTAGHQT